MNWQDQGTPQSLTSINLLWGCKFHFEALPLELVALFYKFLQILQDCHGFVMERRSLQNHSQTIYLTHEVIIVAHSAPNASLVCLY